MKLRVHVTHQININVSLDFIVSGGYYRRMKCIVSLFDCIASTHLYPFSPAIIQYHVCVLLQLKQKIIQTIERRQNQRESRFHRLRRLVSKNEMYCVII